MIFNTNKNAMREDPQHARLLLELADAIVADVQHYTSVEMQADHSEVEDTADGPEVIIGAHAAGAVSVEYGTRFRHASAPILRAAEALGIKVPA